MGKPVWPPRCFVCNKVMSHEGLNEGISWVPHSSYGENSLSEFSHKKCWEELDNIKKRMIYSTSWVKPFIYGKGFENMVDLDLYERDVL